MTGRDEHGAIFDGTYFLVAGGWSYSNRFKTEKCSLSGSTMTCQEQQPELLRYERYPELFLVPDDFCRSTLSTTTKTTTTTTTKTPVTSILILNTKLSQNVPVLTDSSGRVDTNLAFTLDDNTSVWGSCSVTFQNQHYVYGGWGDYTRQISQIDGCRLRRIGDLPFDHYYAACAATSDDQIYLCFNGASSSDYKKCRYAAGPEGPFTDVTLSNYEHRHTRIAASPSNLLRQS